MPYAFRHEAQTAPRGVAVTEVPAEWAAALDAEYEYVKRDQINPVIDFDTPKEAAIHLAYARAWGLSKPEGQKITVRKGTARKDDKEGTLRLVMVPFDPNAAKRGRKPKAESK